jgi:hypothetical protein
MTGITDKFNGSKTRLYVGTAVDPISTVGLSEMATVATYTSIAKIIDLGTIQNEANVIDVPEFGQDYAGKLVGQLNAGTLDMSVAWDPSDSNHIVLQGAVTAKTRKLYIIDWLSGAVGAQGNVCTAGRLYNCTNDGGVADWSTYLEGANPIDATGATQYRCILTSAALDTDLTATGALAGEAEETFVGFNAYVASFGIETTIDDAVKASVSLAIDGGLQFF